MVSSSDLAIGGVLLVLLGLGATSLFRVRGPTDLPQNTMEDPPIQETNILEIRALQDVKSQAQDFLRATFKKPPKIPAGCKTCVNLLALAKGQLTGIDPFTGATVGLGFTSRAGTATRAQAGKTFTFTPAQFTQRIQIGNKVMSEVKAFIDDIRAQIDLLRLNPS